MDALVLLKTLIKLSLRHPHKKDYVPFFKLTAVGCWSKAHPALQEREHLVPSFCEHIFEHKDEAGELGLLSPRRLTLRTSSGLPHVGREGGEP